jgi:CRP/FNR family transcriptional regulator, cyclic AMP receptor protein
VVTEAQLAELTRRGTRRRVRTGTTLFHQGDASTEVYVILAGRLKVSAPSPAGKEIVLAVRGPGEIVGELSPVDGTPRLASVTAVEDAEVAVVQGRAFLEFLAETPGAALDLLRMVTARLRDAERKRAEFGTQDTTARVASRLVEISERFGAGGLRFSQEELAGWIGASREAVARSLRILRDHGVVRTGRQVVEVLDHGALRHIADGSVQFGTDRSAGP